MQSSETPNEQDDLPRATEQAASYLPAAGAGTPLRGSCPNSPGVPNTAPGERPFWGQQDAAAFRAPFHGPVQAWGWGEEGLFVPRNRLRRVGLPGTRLGAPGPSESCPVLPNCCAGNILARLSCVLWTSELKGTGPVLPPQAPPHFPSLLSPLLSLGLTPTHPVAASPAHIPVHSSAD